MRKHRSRKEIGDLQRQGRAVFVLTGHKITNLSSKIYRSQKPRHYSLEKGAITSSRSISRESFLDTSANASFREKRLSLVSGADVRGMRATHKLRNALNKIRMSNEALLDQIEC